MFSRCPYSNQLDEFIHSRSEDEKELSFWKEHGLSCEDCRMQLEIEEVLRLDLGTMPKPGLSPGFERRLWVTLQTQQRMTTVSRLKRFILWSYWVTALTCSCLILYSMTETLELTVQLASALASTGLLLLVATKILLGRLRMEFTDLALDTTFFPEL